MPQNIDYKRNASDIVMPECQFELSDTSMKTKSNI